MFAFSIISLPGGPLTCSRTHSLAATVRIGPALPPRTSRLHSAISRFRVGDRLLYPLPEFRFFSCDQYPQVRARVRRSVWSYGLGACPPLCPDQSMIARHKLLILTCHQAKFS